MWKIDFEDGQQVKAEVLRLIKEGKRTYSSAGEDENGEFYEYCWADASLELSVRVRTNTFSLFLDLTFRFPRPMCPMSVNKLITIPVAGGKIKPGAPILEVLTKSIEAYEPGN